MIWPTGITYSTGMRARLNFGVVTPIDFDCYLIDEVSRSETPLSAPIARRTVDKRTDRSLILASTCRTLSSSLFPRTVIHRGRAKMLTTGLAFDIYNDLERGATSAGDRQRRRWVNL